MFPVRIRPQLPLPCRTHPSISPRLLCSSLTSTSDSPEDLDASSPLIQSYHAAIRETRSPVDPHQLRALAALERLRKELLVAGPSTSLPKQPKQSPESSSSSISKYAGGLFGTWLGTAAKKSDTSVATTSWTNPVSSSSSSKSNTTKGLYLHGGVGCGKTFLMNLFYDSITTGPWATEKQKIHFHKFMLRVHQEMHLARSSLQQHQHVSDAILPAVIRSTLQHGRLLCFDEFQVTDVADALILQRLFTGLWKHGCVVVATSNRPPDDLYLNGLQRDRFVPFIALLKQKCNVVSMDESETDYRLIQKRHSRLQQVYFCGGKEARKEWDQLFYQLIGPETAVTPTSLQTQGRRVPIPQSALSKGVARFTFEDLCQKALGAADYLVIGQFFHTVFVENVPKLTLNEINWVRRFIIFVDSMYECNVKLILHAHTTAHEIFQPGGAASHDEVFAFDRTVSRLEEMSSERYLLKKWRPKTTTAELESKASLLSQRKATVDVVPS